MEEQQSFDEFFRESLADYRETPPPAAWDMVARRLDEDDRRRRGGFFFWPWTVLSLLLLVGGALWLYGWSSHGRFATGGAAEPRERGSAASGLVATRTPAASSHALAAVANRSEEQAAQPASATGTVQPGPAAASGALAAVAPQGTSRTPASVPSSNSPAAQQGRPAPRTGHRAAASTPREAGIAGGSPDPARPTGVPAAAQAAGPGLNPILPASIPQAIAARSAADGTAQPILPAASRSRDQLAQPGTAVLPQGIAAGLPAALNPATASAQPGTAVPRTTLPGAAATPPAAGSDAAVAGRTARQSPAPLRGANPDISPVPTPAATAVRTDPVMLIASLEPVLRLFAGAVLPPVLSIYETGLLEPQRYDPPVEAAPAPPVAAAPDQPAPAMLPPDSLGSSRGSMLSLSAFVGYELRGVKTPPQNMLTAGISLLWKLSEKVSVGMQPALLYGNVPRMMLTHDKAYQRSAVDVTRYLTRDYSPSVLGQIDTLNNYVIREAFDSIIVRGTYIKGSMWQLELPFILQCNPFGPAFRLYGGPSVYVGGGMKVQSLGATETFSIDRQVTIVQSTKMTEEQIKKYFGESSLESYSNYNPNAYSFQALDPVRFGYQFGLGYQRNRMSLDLSVRQQLTGYRQLSSELRRLYSLPAFRLSFGWNLIAPKPARLGPVAP